MPAAPGRVAFPCLATAMTLTPSYHSFLFLVVQVELDRERELRVDESKRFMLNLEDSERDFNIVRRENESLAQQLSQSRAELERYRRYGLSLLFASSNICQMSQHAVQS